MAEAVFFWIFATILVGSALAVIFAREQALLPHAGEGRTGTQRTGQG